MNRQEFDALKPWDILLHNGVIRQVTQTRPGCVTLWNEKTRTEERLFRSADYLCVFTVIK